MAHSEQDHQSTSAREITIGPRHMAFATVPLVAIAVGWLIGTGRLDLPQAPTQLDVSSSLGIVFLTGLSIGGLSCLAVQGGLLATAIMKREKLLHGSTALPGIGARLLPVAQFLVAKSIAYTALGAVLGFFGSKIPMRVQGWLLIAVGVFMIIVVLQMFDVHPFFRRFAFQPPKRVQRLIRSQAKRGGASGPVMLGAMTVLIPCGVTVAMEGLAMASESPLRGALIMLVFTLGTAPMFLLLGFVATNLSKGAYRIFQPVAALLVISVSLVTILGGMRLLGSTIGMGGSGSAATEASILGEPESATLQEASIQAETGAYTPNVVKLRSGIPTRLSLTTENNVGCTRAFTIPSLGIEKMLPATGSEVVELPPMDPGKVVFTCSMGMYSGVFDVVDSASF